LAIGKRGQNARLTSKLTGWQVEIDAEVEVKMGFDEKVAQAVQVVASIPGVLPEQADALVHAGFLSLDNLLEAELADLQAIPQLGDQAESVFQAVQAEAARRKPKGPENDIGQPPGEQNQA